MEWGGSGPGLDVVRIVTVDPRAAESGGSQVSRQQTSELEAKPVDRTGAVGASPACAVGGNSDPSKRAVFPGAGCRGSRRAGADVSPLEEDDLPLERLPRRPLCFYGPVGFGHAEGTAGEDDEAHP
jgi:hypothetical protein